MKVMVLVKATEESEQGIMPGTELLESMGAYNEELVNAGIMLDGNGLKDSTKGVRINFAADGNPSITDGPFAETRELLAGYWIWQVESMDEAVEWARRIPSESGKESTFEIRPVFEPDDFGEEFTPELREKEEELARRLNG